MASRKNPFVAMGRPKGGSMHAPHAIKAPKAPKPPSSKGGGLPAMPPSGVGALGAGPMDSFSPQMPASGFRRGGGVHGHKLMPQFHEDPNYCKGGRVR